MNRSLHLHEASLRVLGTRLGALVDHVHTFNKCTLLVGHHLQHLTRLALVLTGQDDDGIILLNIELCHFSKL